MARTFTPAPTTWDALPLGRCSAFCGRCLTSFPLKADRSISFVTASDQSSSSARIAIAAKHKFRLLKTVGRVILLGGSEYTGEAQIMYRRLAEMSRGRSWNANQGPQVYNIVSRENDILDRFAENIGPKSFFSNTQVVGHNGLEANKGADRWIDLQIDCGHLRVWLGQFGVYVSGDNPGEIWDHWYYYTHRGNMDFYCRILRDRNEWSIAQLRNQDPKCPEGVARGWFGN